MISASPANIQSARRTCFSAIARSVMISAMQARQLARRKRSFSAIARSVMISAPWAEAIGGAANLFQCYSS